MSIDTKPETPERRENGVSGKKAAIAWSKAVMKFFSLLRFVGGNEKAASIDIRRSYLCEEDIGQTEVTHAAAAEVVFGSINN